MSRARDQEASDRTSCPRTDTSSHRGLFSPSYGLSWNPLKQGHILAASEDTTVCHWDVNSYKKGERTIHPLQTYRGHTAFVEDVAWHHFHESLFGSVGDDRQFLIWDDRSAGQSGPKQRVADAHAGEINALSFSPSNEYIACTASSQRSRLSRTRTPNGCSSAGPAPSAPPVPS